MEILHDGLSQVYKSTDPTGLSVVIKKVRREDQQQPHDIKLEVALLTQLEYAEHIIRLLDVQVLDSTHYLTLERFPCNLQHILDSPLFAPATPQFDKAVSMLVRQMTSAIAECHTHSIAHRDVNPANFVVASNGRLKLIDFGTAYEKSLNVNEGPGKMQCEIMTGAFQAPELLFLDKSYDPFALDLWALGATIANMFTPFGERASQDSDDEEGSIPLPWDSSIKSVAKPTRHTLFDGRFSQIALAGSIFRIRGTPTFENWPETVNMPNFRAFRFQQFEGQNLANFLPHLPAEIEGEILKTLDSLLQVSAGKRISASQVLEANWLQNSVKTVDLSHFIDQ